MIKSLTTPLKDEDVVNLKAGDKVKLTGVIYTARDAAHKRMIQSLERRDNLPFEIRGQVIYYTGPAPAKPGYPCGPAGPTTSYRMDPYTPPLLDLGLKGMIGKGLRSKEVIQSMKKNRAVYFGAVGGAAVVISRSIKKCEIIAYPDLGPEGIRKLYVEDFPVIVVIDCRGNNLYEDGPKKFKFSCLPY